MLVSGACWLPKPTFSSSVFGFWSWVTSDRLPPRNQKPKKQSFETEFLVSGKKKWKMILWFPWSFFGFFWFPRKSVWFFGFGCWKTKKNEFFWFLELANFQSQHFPWVFLVSGACYLRKPKKTNSLSRKPKETKKTPGKPKNQNFSLKPRIQILFKDVFLFFGFLVVSGWLFLKDTHAIHGMFPIT